jgi:hypothetical protein
MLEQNLDFQIHPISFKPQGDLVTVAARMNLPEWQSPSEASPYLRRQQPLMPFDFRSPFLCVAATVGAAAPAFERMDA